MIIIELLLIGFSLSMDTFSLSLGIGSFNLRKRKMLFFSLIVGICHFFMPLIGVFLGSFLMKIASFNTDKLLFIVFLFIAIEMFFSLFSKEEKEYDLHFLNILLYAFSVSLDSLTVGIALDGYYIVGPIIFMLEAFFFTYLGLALGKYSYEKLGFVSKIIGFIIIVILALVHLF